MLVAVRGVHLDVLDEHGSIQNINLHAWDPKPCEHELP